MIFWFKIAALAITAYGILAISAWAFCEARHHPPRDNGPK